MWSATWKRRLWIPRELICEQETKEEWFVRENFALQHVIDKSCAPLLHEREPETVWRRQRVDHRGELERANNRHIRRTIYETKTQGTNPRHIGAWKRPRKSEQKPNTYPILGVRPMRIYSLVVRPAPLDEACGKRQACPQISIFSCMLSCQEADEE